VAAGTPLLRILIETIMFTEEFMVTWLILCYAHVEQAQGEIDR
jgi:hypothetical protein